VVVLTTGLLVRNVFGQRCGRLGKYVACTLRQRIYNSVKQVSDTLLSENGHAFRKVLLVRYPHPEAWSLAFLTSVPAEVIDQFDEAYVAYYSHDPEPGERLLFFVRKADTIELICRWTWHCAPSFRWEWWQIPKPGSTAPSTTIPNQTNLFRNRTMRTHYCGTPNIDQLDQTVSLCGWAHRRRDHGGVIFIDARPRGWRKSSAIRITPRCSRLPSRCAMNSCCASPASAAALKARPMPT
jgi:hypothetical protein